MGTESSQVKSTQGSTQAGIFPIAFSPVQEACVPLHGRARRPGLWATGTASPVYPGYGSFLAKPFGSWFKPNAPPGRAVGSPRTRRAEHLICGWWLCFSSAACCCWPSAEARRGGRPPRGPPSRLPRPDRAGKKYSRGHTAHAPLEPHAPVTAAPRGASAQKPEHAQVVLTRYCSLLRDRRCSASGHADHDADRHTHCTRGPREVVS